MIRPVYIVIISLLSVSVLAVSPQHDQYYSDDIFTAIEEAKQRTHHYDYSRAHRYNRSTSQSIQIPRLLNSEMDKQVIEGAVGATAAGNNRDANLDEPLRQARRNQDVEGENLNTNTLNNSEQEPILERSSAIYIREIHYSGQEFTGTATNIRSDVSISATARP